MEKADLMSVIEFTGEQAGHKKYNVSIDQKETLFEYVDKHLPMVLGAKTRQTAPWWLENAEILNAMSTQKPRPAEYWRKSVMTIVFSVSNTNSIQPPTCHPVSSSPLLCETIGSSACEPELQVSQISNESTALSELQHEILMKETPDENGHEAIPIKSPIRYDNKENEHFGLLNSPVPTPDGLFNDLTSLVSKATDKMVMDIRTKNQNLQNQLDELRKATQDVVCEVGTNLLELNESLDALEKRVQSFSSNLHKELNPLKLGFLSSICLLDVPVVQSLPKSDGR
ncbi:hypothetical protein QAD02_015835 [Eretmocerus hayati]|uniref:Uncharacterized protein n=1 Tax=Eretmocerus hayati TaxID=131215 RepID=A0ACC2P9E5_9HYME|nr:hypothetical protein QAD02_015835 [Eretmocerus hayati]